MEKILNKDYWHPVSELPEHDGWIWTTLGNKGPASKIKAIYYKQKDQTGHGKTRLRNQVIGNVNTIRYWCWPIPLPDESKDNSIKSQTLF